jgi:tetratricopeptide (TPR) repeat protein
MVRSSVVFWIISLFVATFSRAETRHAIVIGNDAYPGNRLQNARNDASAVYQALKNIGYFATLVLDADRASLSSQIDRYVESLKPGDTAVVYYAGHGFQLDGENFLVPTDFQVLSPTEAKRQAYSLSALLERLTSHGATTQIVILDACRDNPFLGTRSTAGGWAGLGTSAGSFLAFGTSPGSTSSDAPSQGHGLFTKALLQYLTSSNSDIEEMLRQVREDVIRASDGKQVPWIASSLIGTFHVRPELDTVNRMLPPTDGNALELRDVYGRSLRGTTPSSTTTDLSDLPVNIQEKVQKASDLSRGAHFSEAITILEDVLMLQPTCSIALRLLGLALHAVGRDMEATITFNRQLQLDPRDEVTSSYRCAVEGLNISPNVITDCTAAIQLHPSAQNYLALAAVLYAQGNYQEAYQDVTQSISLEPTDLAYSLRGSILTQQGQVGSAQRDYSRATQIARTR